jgi:hypothetical protein
VAEVVAGIETPSERTIRLTVLGAPTIHGRRDIAEHFFVSAYLASAVGANGATAAGFAKESLDAQGASGFSFADIAADRAGVRFGNSVLKRHFAVGALGASFKCGSFVPSIEGLPDGLSAGQFRAQFGKKESPAVLAQLKEIDRRIDVLPPYRPVEFKLDAGSLAPQNGGPLAPRED